MAYSGWHRWRNISSDKKNQPLNIPVPDGMHAILYKKTDILSLKYLSCDQRFLRYGHLLKEIIEDILL